MVRLFFFDLRCRFAPTMRRLRSGYLRDLAEIPAALQPDMGLSDARLADLAEAQARADLAARRADEARRLLRILNRIAQSRGFPPLRWKSGVAS